MKSTKILYIAVYCIDDHSGDWLNQMTNMRLFTKKHPKAKIFTYTDEDYKITALYKGRKSKALILKSSRSPRL